jgi:glycosyltransferase involved in cell wall biosynthesis
MSTERILVCTPTYHRVEPLQAAIESVLNQTYTDLLHVVVKDGCETGPGCERCRETDRIGRLYAERDSRFRYVSLTEHRGGYGFYARNHAIEISDCPLIAYLDDDNWWELNHLQTLHDAMTHSAAMFAFSGTNVRDWQGRLVARRISRVPYFSGIDTNEILHRRELITLHGGWKPTDAVHHNHDWELVCRWMRAREPFVATGLATSNYKLSPRDSLLRFWYSHYKNRLRFALSRVFQSNEQRYRARTVRA